MYQQRYSYVGKSYVAHAEVASELVNQYSVQWAEDMLKEEMRFRLRCILYERELMKIQFPTTWWDALVERWVPEVVLTWTWLPDWVQRKLHTNYTVITGTAIYQGVIPQEVKSSRLDIVRYNPEDFRKIDY